MLVRRSLLRRLLGLHASGPDAEIDQDRRGDEDRRIGADQHHAEDHGRDEAVDGMAAEEQQRQQRKRHRHVGDDRARQRRVDRDVEQVRHRHPLVAAQHLADAVVDDDGVVERIAEDGEQRRDARQIEVDLHQRHVADGQHQIVHVGDHGAERELPFEAEPEIDQDREDREPEPDRAVGREARSTPADRPPRSGGTPRRSPERLAHLGDGGLLRLLAAGLLRDADQHVGRGAELLQLHLAETESAERRAHLGEIGRPGLRLHLDQRAADEVDAEIEPVEEEQQDGDDRQHRRDRKADAPKAHEVELGVVRDDPQQRDGGMQPHVDASPMKSRAAAGATTAPTRPRSAASG